VAALKNTKICAEPYPKARYRSKVYKINLAFIGPVEQINE